MPESRRLSRTLAVAALATLLVGGGAAVANAVDDPPPTATLNPPHVWVDPTNPAGEYHLSVEIHFPLPAGIWDFKGEKLLIVEPQADCTAEATDYGMLYACDGIGDPIPGEYTVGFVTHVVEGGGSIPPIPAIPITVCPLTGCSDLFDFSVDGASSPACASDLSSLGNVTYRFNVPWNASGVAFGSIPGVSDADWEPLSETAADGARFTLLGAIDPGHYVLPITVTDEFGGPHEADFAFDVGGPDSAACLRLAATGTDVGTPTAWMLVLLALGTALVLTARVRRRA